MIETGRWHRLHSIPYKERKCIVCDTIEDEFYFILECSKYADIRKQVAQWAMIAHLGASIMFGDTIIDDALRQVTLNMKQ